jgi:sulfur carrier protein
MIVQLNGEKKNIRVNSTISDLLAFLEVKILQVAVELNGSIISKSDYETTILKSDDKIEIVNFIGGG